MSIIQGNALSGGSSGYNLTNSLRFRSSASAYLNRTPSVAGSAQKFTMSCWVKLGSDPQSSAQITFLNAGNGAQTNTGNDCIQLRTNGTALQVGCLGRGGTGGNYAQFTAYLRDYAAWYHIVVAVDTTQATQANRCRAYINGVEQTSYVANGFTSSYSFSYINQAYAHLVGQQNEGGGPQYTDAYLAEYNFIDGQALTPSSFGSFNAYGSWSPVRYGGSYGTNGFYLPFTNNTSTTTLGYDFSPNGNNWTTNNISLTAGTTYDSMTDVPTLTSATAANYCTLNPVLPIPSGTISQGNLNYLRGSTANHGSVGATFAIPTTGKWYWEVTACANSGGSGNNEVIGVANILNNPQLPSAGSEIGSGSRGDYAYRSNGVKYNNGSQGSYGATYTNGDVIGVAWNSDSGTLTFYKNGTSQGTAFSSITQVDGKFVAASSNAESSNGDSYNFGQRPFAYTPPSGFVALNTYNL